DVGRIAGERGPPERPDSAAEEGPNIGRDEAPVCERVVYTTFTRLTSQVVAIIENIGAAPDVLEHRLDVPDDGLAGKTQVLVGIRRAQCGRLLDRVAPRDVAV